MAKSAADEAASRTNEPLAADQLRDIARKAYQQALHIEPANVDAAQGLAQLYMQMQDYEHATAILTAAVKLNPKAAGVWFQLGMIHSNRKDWNPAIECLGKAAQLEPENRLYVNTLGHALARSGKPQEALQVYLRVNPEAKAYLNVARGMQHINQLDLSRQYLEMSLQRDPMLAEAHQLLALLNGGPAAALQQTSATQVEAGAVQSIPTN